MSKTYSDLLSEVKSKVRTVSLDEMKRRLEAREDYVFVDVREKDEVRQGFIPGAISIPRGFLEMQAEQKLPDKNAKLVVYCAGGVRSAFAAKTLAELGYTNVESANPGFVRWKDLGYPVEKPPELTPEQLERYSRHLLLPEVGDAAHLYPHAFLNVIVLVPALIWSMYLLYRGLPVVLRTDPGRGMLMASALIAYLLVAWVSLLGLTVVLWIRGIGPRLGA